MSSIFTQIIAGKIPAYKIAENDQFFAFLDIRPVAKGHALVVPKQEIDYLFDIDDQLLAELILYAKRVAIAMKKVIPCEKIGVTVLGLEVRHAHVHLVPLDETGIIDFKKPRLEFSPEQYKDLAAKINENFY
ncbi:MAG: HIT family protein [Chitinophagales bacterium]|nr:HIT family protein [Bacteroidota bacterium]MCB9043214.1 HIT family protein [Chitinophagales bacterium]